MNMHIREITLQPLDRCPECGNLKGWDLGFLRRVDLLFVVHKKSKTFSRDGDRRPYCIEEHADEMRKKFPDYPVRESEAPDGLYPAIIIPKDYVGRCVRIIPISEEQIDEDEARKRALEGRK